MHCSCCNGFHLMVEQWFVMHNLVFGQVLVSLFSHRPVCVCSGCGYLGSSARPVCNSPRASAAAYATGHGDSGCCHRHLDAAAIFIRGEFPSIENAPKIIVINTHLDATARCSWCALPKHFALWLCLLGLPIGSSCKLVANLFMIAFWHVDTRNSMMPSSSQAPECCCKMFLRCFCIILPFGVAISLLNTLIYNMFQH